MFKSITLVALVTLNSFSIASWATPVTSTRSLKEAQCTACTTKCDAKNEMCSITCDDKVPGNNCGKKFKHVTPFGVLEVTPKRGTP